MKKQSSLHLLGQTKSLIGRRQILRFFSAMGSSIVLKACLPQNTQATSTQPAVAQLPTGCVARPELAEGPVFVEDDLNRSDIRLDPSRGITSEGIPLQLTFRISSIIKNACTPLANAQVDLWQCDAYGLYSDTSELGMDTVGQKFLRGYQKTDSNGMATFTSIYPGGYPGRAIHIHIKVRTNEGYDFTSQVFFETQLTEKVFTQAPYNQRGQNWTRNEDDGIYRNGGEQMVLDVSETDTGYTTTFDIALDLSERNS